MVMSHDFWEHLAKHYPSYTNPQMGDDVRTMIDLATGFGVDFNGAHVLDIGCGTGTVAIPLAMMGATVCAMDISDGMLERLKSDSHAAGVTEKIAAHKSDWDSFALDGEYDIVLASMTPAVSTDAHYDKYIQAAKKWGIFVGWGAYKRNAFLEGLLGHHGGKYIEPNNKAAKFYDLITAKGKKANLDFFETEWAETYSMDKALDYAVSHLERTHISPDMEKIHSILDQWEQNGSVTITTQAQKGVVVWKA